MRISPFVHHIVILGPKHSGKTSAGRELAKLLGGAFTDLDELIKAQTGKSSRALFKESPEAFRAAELRALESLFPVQPSRGVAECGGIVRQDRNAPGVIAAGGGIIDNPKARQLLCEGNGFSLVNLEASAETAWERISQASAQGGEMPPFLDTASPRETHWILHVRRAAAYREIAHLTVSGEGKTPEETGQELFKLLELLSDETVPKPAP
ncbi:MAG: shikimate kinase [Treponema sp.]|jgi:shikimate kinase|nr:shikimate kinase [Treponema sp.]